MKEKILTNLHIIIRTLYMLIRQKSSLEKKNDVTKIQF